MLLNPLNPKDVKILVIGDVMLDIYNYGDANRISPEAPVPVFHSKEIKTYLGGAGNTYLNLHNTGVNAYLLGRIGDDYYGNTLRSIISKVDTAGTKANLLWELNVPTIVKERIVARSQQIVRVDTEKIVPLSVKAAEYIYAAYQVFNNGKNFDAIILSDYGKGTICDTLIDILYSDPIFYNVPIFIDPFPKNAQLYKNAWYITPNSKEFDEMGGLDMFQYILKIQNVLRTEGEHGMTLFNKLGEHHVDTIAQTVYDVSGAGDTVVSTLAAAIAMGYTTNDALFIANACAGSVVSQSGTTAVHPDFFKKAIEGVRNASYYTKPCQRKQMR